MAVNDRDVFEELRNLVVVYEGLHTYGGLAGRDMEAMAIGIAESVKDDHIRARIGQVRYLGELLEEWGIPMMEPIGGHAIFSTPSAFIRSSSRTSSRRRRWRRSSIWTAAFAQWNAAL